MVYHFRGTEHRQVLAIITSSCTPPCPTLNVEHSHLTPFYVPLTRMPVKAAADGHTGAAIAPLTSH